MGGLIVVYYAGMIGRRLRTLMTSGAAVYLARPRSSRGSACSLLSAPKAEGQGLASDRPKGALN
jgi:hypothetical protein